MLHLPLWPHRIILILFENLLKFPIYKLYMPHKREKVITVSLIMPFTLCNIIENEIVSCLQSLYNGLLLS